MCHMSHVTYIYFSSSSFFKDVKLVGGWFVINGATPSSYNTAATSFARHSVFQYWHHSPATNLPADFLPSPPTLPSPKIP